MKYVVTATSFTRKNNEGNDFVHNGYFRDEEIDTYTNPIFSHCKNEYEIEETYESYWNRLNGDYNNSEIVKVMNVICLNPSLRESIRDRNPREIYRYVSMGIINP